MFDQKQIAELAELVNATHCTDMSEDHLRAMAEKAARSTERLAEEDVPYVSPQGATGNHRLMVIVPPPRAGKRPSILVAVDVIEAVPGGSGPMDG